MPKKSDRNHDFPLYGLNATLGNIIKDTERGEYVKEKHVQNLMRHVGAAFEYIDSGRIMAGRDMLKQAIDYANSPNHWE